MQIVEEVNQQEQLIDQFLKVRHKTELLCESLTLEDMVMSTTQETSPPKWHLAHTTWFFESFLLLPFNKNYQVYSSQYSYIFNSYYLSINKPLEKSKRSFLSRPSTTDIIGYRRYVNEEVENLIKFNKEEWDEIEQIVELGIAHEEQHQELLLMDIKQSFFSNPLHPAYEAGQYIETFIETCSQEWLPFKEGLIEVGVSGDRKSFSFDNEKDRHKVWVDSFYLSSHLVTNNEYLNFINSDGYKRPEFWSSDGFTWITENKISAPHYWVERDNEYWEFSHYGLNPLKHEAPVSHVSFHEALAFAKFMNSRLPTETEWEFASFHEPLSGQFLEDDFYLPNVSLNDYQHFSQIHGTLWEWTSSSYSPYPRYNPYVGGLGEYNEKFMNQQYVLRGGSCVTPIKHYRRTYRNYYYPQMRWQFCGIRLAKDNL